MNESKEKLFAAMIDAFPSPVLLVDEDVRIMATNAAANRLIGLEAKSSLRKRGGDALACLHSSEAGCGHGEMCKDCVIRRSVKCSFQGSKVVRARTKMELHDAQGRRELFLLVTAAPINFEGVDYTILTLEDIGELVEMKSLIPICAYCKKIRNDSEYWEQLENYLGKQLDLAFSHGICPDCFQKQLEELKKLK